MVRFNLLVLTGGLLGYLVSIIASTALVLLFLRLNSRMMPDRKVMQLFLWDREKPPPSPAPAIALGAATLSQAYLLKHGVFVVMILVQDFLVTYGNRLFGGDFPGIPLLKLALLAALLMAAMSLLAVLSIWIATAFFNFLTGEMNEIKEIREGNVAVAILFAFVLFAITAILNEGIEDLSRALVPYSRAGVVRIP